MIIQSHPKPSIGPPNRADGKAGDGRKLDIEPVGQFPGNKRLPKETGGGVYKGLAYRNAEKAMGKSSRNLIAEVKLGALDNACKATGNILHSTSFVATLQFPDEYRYHLNQVAGLSSHYIIFLKRKFGPMALGELVKIPMEQCTSIEYRDRRPIHVLLIGVLLSIAALISLAFFIWNWDSLAAGTTVPVGGLLVGAAIGMRWAFGARRHELTFALKGRSNVKWRSRSGDFKYKVGSVGKVLEFARARDLLTEKQPHGHVGSDDHIPIRDPKQ